MTVLNSIYSFSKTRASWALLLLVVVALELCALYFQHVMNLAPCVMCIYERVALLGVALAAVIGLFIPSSTFTRYVALLGWAVSSAKGLELALKHVDYQINPSPFNTCDIFVRFPDFAPLNQWVPWAFEAYGECSKITWSFLTLSMPQWLVIVFACSLISALIVSIAQFAPTRQSA